MRMLSALTLSVLFALPAAAQDITESIADVNFEVEQQLFRGSNLEYRFPAGRSYGIVVAADVAADVEAELQGKSHLTWPNILTQSWEGQAGGGFMSVIMALDLSVEARLDGPIDLQIVEPDFTNNPISYSFWSDSTEWLHDAYFDTFLLSGGDPEFAIIEINQNTGALPALYWDPGLEYSLDLVVVDYSLVFDGAFQAVPDATVTLRGTEIVTSARSVTEADGTVELRAPNTNDGTARFTSVWKGTAPSTFDLVMGFDPEFRLVDNSDGTTNAGVNNTINEFFSGYSNVTVPIAMDGDNLVTSKNTPYDHDLPAIDTDRASMDFGQVLVGNESQLNLVIEDLGSIDLWGDVAVEGEGFSISRPDIDVDGNGEMALTVTFRPDVAGQADGELILTSNDPVNPTVAIPLSGRGFEQGDDTANPDTGNGGPGGEAGIRGCGCSSAPTGSLAWLGLIPAMGFVLRRRR